MKKRLIVILCFLTSVVFAGKVIFVRGSGYPVAPPPPAYPPVTNGLVYWYSFDTNGTDNWDGGHGTNFGATQVTGYRNNCYSFDDDNNNYVGAGNIGNITGTLTIAFWTKVGRFFGEDWAVGKDQAGARSYCVGFTFGALNFQIAGADVTPSGGTMSTNQWYHLAFTYDDSADQVVTYLNGVTNGVATTAAVIPVTAAEFCIGRRSYSEGNEGYCNALIDEVLIYDRALTGTEISQLYNAQ